MKKVALILFTLLIIMGCNQTENSTIKIGALLSLTGDIAEYGQRVKKGIDLACEEINESGGVKGEKIEIIYENTRGFPKDGVNGVYKLISTNEVKIIIGTISSSVTLAVEPITTKNKILLFSPAASSPKLSGISSYFFRNWPSDVYEANYLAEFAIEELNLKDAAILYVNNDYGIGLANEFINRFKELDGKILVSETYQQNSTDLRAQLTKIGSYKPSAIYLAGYHREMAYATKQIRELNINCQILADADYGVQELLELTGNTSEGAIFSIPRTDFTDSSSKAFRDNFYNKYKSEPSVFEANGYDVVYILKKAIEAVGYNIDSLSSYIAGIKNYSGAAGLQSFNKDGDVQKPISIKQVINNQFITVK